MLYFDVLPLHPLPQPLESLTGYLIRVAEVNHLPSIDALALLCFPQSSRRIVRNFNDYTPLTLEDAACTLARTQAELQQMTFYHLGRKFGRSTHPQKMSRFLNGSLAHHLRWCPECLAEDNYYRLTWRFKSLIGCPDHGCVLLEHCPHCGQPVPLFKAPLRLGMCSICHGDLRLVASENVSAQTVQVEAELLARLLTPHPIENNPVPAVRRLGRQYLQARMKIGLNGAKTAARLELTHTVIEGIEFGNTDRRGCSFEHYRRYADLVGLDLNCLLETSIAL